ncbi:MAG: tetratricopeptide repeat protein [Bacteroidetes bacterium]|nr:tetratricopeptide repeat protein [Bacteroidota bacterium]
MTFFSAATGQEGDFYQFLSENNSLNEFLKPQLSNRLIPFAGNENVNKKRLQSAVANKNDKVIVASAGNLGLLYLKKEDPAAAYNYFNTSLEAAKRIKSQKAIGIALLQCALAQQELKNYSTAISFYNESSTVNGQGKLPKVNAFILAQTGQCHVSLREYEKAEMSFRRAANAYSGLKMNSQAAVCYNSIGEVYLRQNDFKRAQENFNTGLTIIATEKEPKLKALLHRNLGLTEFKRGRFEMALEYFYKSLDYENQLIIHKLIKDSYLQLFTYFSFSDNFTKADFYHEKYRDLKDSLSTAAKKTPSGKIALKTELEEKERVIDLLQKQYQEQSLASNAKQLELSQIITKTDIALQEKDQALEEKTAEVEQLTREKAISERDLALKELMISKQKNFRNLLIILSACAIFFVLLLYNRYTFKKKSNVKLIQSNSELEDTLKRLHATQDQLIQSEKMASLGQLTAGIAHEIQNPLNFVNNFSEGALEVIDEFTATEDPLERKELADELKGSLSKIHEHGKRAERIVKSMLQHSRQGSDEKEIADVNQLLHEAVNLAYHGMRANHKDFQCAIEENLQADLPKAEVVQQDMNRVFLNLANNAFYAMREKVQKENGGKSLLKISSILKKDKIEIRLRDNGPGIPTTIAEKIFEPFFTTKPSGQGTALGLSMSFDIIKNRHQGSLQLDSKENEYTEFIITIPLKG